MWHSSTAREYDTRGTCRGTRRLAHIIVSYRAILSAFYLPCGPRADPSCRGSTAAIAVGSVGAVARVLLAQLHCAREALRSRSAQMEALRVALLCGCAAWQVAAVGAAQEDGEPPRGQTREHEHVSTDGKPPLPGGYEMGDKVYYTGQSSILLWPQPQVRDQATGSVSPPCVWPQQQAQSHHRAQVSRMPPPPGHVQEGRGGDV